MSELFNITQEQSSLNSLLNDHENRGHQQFGLHRPAFRLHDQPAQYYLTAHMEELLSKRELVFMENSCISGNCRSSYRLIPPNFVKVLQAKYLVYPECRSAAVLTNAENSADLWPASLIFIDCLDSSEAFHVSGSSRLIRHEALINYRNNRTREVIDEMYSSANVSPRYWIILEIQQAYQQNTNFFPGLEKSPEQASSSYHEQNQHSGNSEPRFVRYPAAHGINRQKLQSVTERVTTKLLLDEKLCHFLEHINLHILLSRQRHFFKTVFGMYGKRNRVPDNLREFYRHQIHPLMNDFYLDLAIGHLLQALTELDFTEQESSLLKSKLIQSS